MSDKTSLGDRMKWYESRYTSDQFMPMVPVLARMDGRSFHTFTKGLKRPYDKRLSDLMIAVTKFLVQETNARCGYVQSDEISLVWLAEDWESDIFFSGKLQKMNSVLASLTSTYFNLLLPQYLPEKVPTISNKDTVPTVPVFDSRVFQVPTNFEAVNCFIWREQDATRNSVQMAAQSCFSHADCQNKSGSELQDMLWKQMDINWNDYPNFFKRGTYVRRKNIERRFTAEELAALPPKHAANTNPDLTIKRTAVMEENFPPLARIINREEVIFYGAEPVERAESNVDEHMD
jgi:tRNA(His) 5'-end guanylyltransferase